MILGCSSMADAVNFTGAVDRDLPKRAKVIAAKSDTSVYALLNAELRPPVTANAIRRQNSLSPVFGDKRHTLR